MNAKEIEAKVEELWAKKSMRPRLVVGALVALIVGLELVHYLSKHGT